MSENKVEVELAVLRSEFDSFRREMREEMEAINKSTSELVDAWKAAGTLVKVVKLAAAVMTGLSTLWALVAFGHIQVK